MAAAKQDGRNNGGKKDDVGSRAVQIVRQLNEDLNSSSQGKGCGTREGSKASAIFAQKDLMNFSVEDVMQRIEEMVSLR